MEYIIILFVYNIFIIMVLANVLVSSMDCVSDYLTIYHIEKFLQINNLPDDILKVSEHHSIFDMDEHEFVEMLERKKSIEIYSKKGEKDGTK